jgi:hypothetical protein
MPEEGFDGSVPAFHGRFGGGQQFGGSDFDEDGSGDVTPQVLIARAGIENFQIGIIAMGNEPLDGDDGIGSGHDREGFLSGGRKILLGRL